MSHKKKQLALTKSLMLESLFGPAPILESEESQAYDTFLERVAVTVAPADVIEEMFVRHFVDLSWENNRYAALKAAVIKAAIPSALQDILAPLVDGSWRFGAIDVYDEHGALKPRPSLEYANDYIRRDAQRIDEINNILRKASLTMKDVEFRAMDLAMDKLDRINQVMSRLEARRNALMGEIERRRKTLAADLRRVTDTVDAEFEEIEPMGGAA